MITVQVWDRNNTKAVDKAIREILVGLGFPQTEAEKAHPRADPRPQRG